MLFEKLQVLTNEQWAWNVRERPFKFTPIHCLSFDIYFLYSYGCCSDQLEHCGDSCLGCKIFKPNLNQARSARAPGLETSLAIMFQYLNVSRIKILVSFHVASFSQKSLLQIGFSFCKWEHNYCNFVRKKVTCEVNINLLSFYLAIYMARSNHCLFSSVLIVLGSKRTARCTGKTP